MNYIGQYLNEVASAFGLESVAVLLLLFIVVLGVVKCIQ